MSNKEIYIIKFIKKNLYNIVSTTLAIAFFVTSVIFFNISNKVHSLSYFIEKPIKIIESSLFPKFKIKYGDETITTDLYLIRLSIINDGDYSIYKEDVRKPIRFSTDAKLVDIKISHTSEDDSSNFSIKKDLNLNMDIISYTLDWEYFDPNYAVTITWFVESASEPKVSLEGKILYINQFKQISNTQAFARKSGWVSYLTNNHGEDEKIPISIEKILTKYNQVEINN